MKHSSKSAISTDLTFKLGHIVLKSERLVHKNVSELSFATGRPLVFEIAHHPCKKFHIIRVVFQDQAMCTCTSFRSAKTYKIGKKWFIFSHIDKFWKRHNWTN